MHSSNNTNKLSPQEPLFLCKKRRTGSNNTNKLSPQELHPRMYNGCHSSNNTNKLSPQEPGYTQGLATLVQIIQINLVLKNFRYN